MTDATLTTTIEQTVDIAASPDHRDGWAWFVGQRLVAAAAESQ